MSIMVNDHAGEVSNENDGLTCYVSKRKSEEWLTAKLQTLVLDWKTSILQGFRQMTNLITKNWNVVAHYFLFEA